MSQNNNNSGPGPWTRVASVALSITGPFTLISLLALGGVHITLWMILLALVATIALVWTAIRFAMQEQSHHDHKNDKNDKDKGARGDDDSHSPKVFVGRVAHGIMTSAAGKRHEPIVSIMWRDKDKSGDIVVDNDQVGQSVLGFGAALTGSACAVFNRMDYADRDEVMDDLFAPHRMNLNVCRISIGSSDYHPELYSYSDGAADPELKNFSIDRDRPYVLPMVQMARAINPELFLLASPWSPPAWMKPNGTMLGGEMGAQHFPAYAQYFVRFLEAYEEEGIEVNAVTVQNEVEADQGGRMPAATYTADLEKQFVKAHLGPAFKAAGRDEQIWILDHNFDLAPRAIDSLNDAELGQFTKSIAWHGYGGSASQVGTVHDLHPDAQHYFTEFNTFIDAPQYMTDWTYWGVQIGEAMRNWCRSYTMWNVALDEHGKPNIGPFTCGGVVTIDSNSGDVSYSGGYWGLGHYSRFVERGAVRIDSQGTVDGIMHVAFRNPAGDRVLVLSNTGADRTLTIESDGQLLDVRLDADSVTTLTW